MKISKIKAFQIYDSRGYPTIACYIEDETGNSEISMVPSGASTGEREAIELRDNNKLEWDGKGVSKAIRYINDIIAPKLIGLNVTDQKNIDQIMIDLDGTYNKSKLGANSILSVSMAIAKLAAKNLHKPLFQYLRENLLLNKNNKYFFPIPIVNVINGGKHANNNLDFQEFMFVPLCPDSWDNCLKIVDECFLSLQKILLRNNQSISKGDEGGFSINFNNISDVFELLSLAVETAGYKLGVDVGFGIDVAASEFYSNSKYNLKIVNKSFTSKELLEFYLELINKYPIVYLEDPFDQNDWENFTELTKIVKNKVLIVGDDLYCTNVNLLQKGINQCATNSILIKLNQIGTLSECIETILLAQKNNLNFIISHRSGETEDTFIADLSIATNSKLIKTGSMSRSERLAKYNRITIIDKTIKELNKSNWEEICQN